MQYRLFEPIIEPIITVFYSVHSSIESPTTGVDLITSVEHQAHRSCTTYKRAQILHCWGRDCNSEETSSCQMRIANSPVGEILLDNVSPGGLSTV